MAKSSKAKKKSAKAAKKTYKKARKTKKTTKAKKVATRRLDSCAAEEKAVDLAQAEVEKLVKDLQDSDLTDELRRRLEALLRTARTKRARAETALRRCRREHPGHPG